jgi:hypothetical protein
MTMPESDGFSIPPNLFHAQAFDARTNQLKKKLIAPHQPCQRVLPV